MVDNVAARQAPSTSETSRGAEAALATVMLACGPVNLKLLYHTSATHM